MELLLNGNGIGLIAFLVILTSMGLWIRALRGVAVPEDRTPFVLAWAIGTVLAVAALWLGEAGSWLRVPAWLAAIVGAFALLTVLISRQRVGDGSIAVGDTIPAFSAADDRGDTFASEELSGSLALIKFFRGHW